MYKIVVYVVVIFILLIAFSGCKALNLLTFHGYKNEFTIDTIHVEYKKDSSSVDTIRNVKKYYVHDTNPRTVETKWYITLMLIIVATAIILIRNN
jgi:homoserine trans-succinylase